MRQISLLQDAENTPSSYLCGKISEILLTKCKLHPYFVDKARLWCYNSHRNLCRGLFMPSCCRVDNIESVDLWCPVGPGRMSEITDYICRKTRRRKPAKLRRVVRHNKSAGQSRVTRFHMVSSGFWISVFRSKGDGSALKGPNKNFFLNGGKNEKLVD